MLSGETIWRAGERAAVIVVVSGVLTFSGPVAHAQGSGETATKIIPQIAVGAFDGNALRYKTVIQVVNEAGTAATVSGNFYNQDGTASTLVLTTNLSTLPTVTGSFTSVNLPPNSVLIITAATAPSLTVNWAKIVSTGGTVSASAYFDLTNGAGTLLQSRAGVSASEAGLSRFTIPRVRNVGDGLDVGFALVNTGTASATLAATLRSATGSALATRNLTLAAGAHTAAFAKDFFALTGETAGTNYSFIVFESASAQFAATALAIEGGALASFPISVPQSVTAAGELADGSVTAAKLAAGQVVKSINSLKDNVTLIAGTNVTITPAGNGLSISAAGSTANLNVTTDSATLFRTALGAGALTSNTTGSFNTATGAEALYSNTTGFENVASGYQSLYSNSVGNGNTASGNRALYSNTGNYNTANGDRALYFNTTGLANTANGAAALYFNTTGNYNMADGYRALYSNTTGSGNTASGYQALYANVTGLDNTASGYRALYSNTNGDSNTATGYQALSANTTGDLNTATGYQALNGNTSGNGNTASGYQALNSNTTGGSNTSTGYQALAANTTGGSNTANGYRALDGNSTGGFNTATGYQALDSNTTGFYNTAAGGGALNNNTSGANNTAIGYNADVSTGNLTNATAIGNGATVNASNKVRLGNSAVTVIEGQVAFSFASDRTRKENFRPVDTEDVLRKIQNLEVTSWNYIGNDPKQFRHYGPMAQDFFAAFGHDEVGTIGTPTTLTSGDIDGILMLAMKAVEKRTAELRQENELLKAALEELKAEVKSLLR